MTQVSKPNYYKFLTVDMDVHAAQKMIWGEEVWRKHIEMQIFEYRFRLGKKEGNEESALEKIKYLEGLLK